jgi:hypothetical protein
VKSTGENASLSPAHLRENEIEFDERIPCESLPGLADGSIQLEQLARSARVRPIRNRPLL